MIKIKDAETLYDYLAPDFSLAQSQALFKVFQEVGIVLVRDIHSPKFEPWPDSVMLVEIKLGQHGVGFNMSIRQLSYSESMTVNQIADIIKEQCLKEAKLLFPENNTEGGGDDSEEVPPSPDAN